MPDPRIILVTSENNADADEHVRTIDPRGAVVAYPENNLHPARHLDALVPALKTRAARPSDGPLVVLTHSEALLSAFAELVESGRLRPDDVAVHLVLSDEVRICRFTTDGVLDGPWCFGFLTPSPRRKPVDVWDEIVKED